MRQHIQQQRQQQTKALIPYRISRRLKEKYIRVGLQQSLEPPAEQDGLSLATHLFQAENTQTFPTINQINRNTVMNVTQQPILLSQRLRFSASSSFLRQKATLHIPQQVWKRLTQPKTIRNTGILSCTVQSCRYTAPIVNNDK